MARRLQILLVVDVEGAVVAEELEALLPTERDDRFVRRLSEFGAPAVQRIGGTVQPIDWQSMGRACEAAAGWVREAIKDHVPTLYVGGQGPLPVFTHLGFALSRFTGDQFVVNRNHGGPWQVLPIADATADTDVLTARDGFRTSQSVATGRVAIYVDTGGRQVLADKIREAISGQGGDLAEIVSLRSPEPLSLTAATVPALARELTRELPRIGSMYPHHDGLALFVAGPTELAFLVGRALSPTVAAATWLTNFAATHYDVLYSLPFADRPQLQLSRDPAEELERRKVHDVLAAAVQDLQKQLTPEDLPDDVAPEARARFVTRLGKLQLETTESEEFSLSVARGRFAFGAGLLEALRGGTGQVQQDFAKLLLLHEVLHDDQGIRTTNYFDVGRAGVVLERIDYAADIFALKVATRLELRRGGVQAEEEARLILCRWLDAAIFGIEAFDQLANRVRIDRLAERRLRRYLTWHLQRARAETVETSAHAAMLLAGDLTAELAPLAGRIDERHDKIVLHASRETEFFASLNGLLVRHGTRPGFEPGHLVDAVRGFNRTATQKAMHFVVEENKSILTPWRA